MRPTPIHPWNIPRKPEDKGIWIKRDDLTGCVLTGNKVRKLEFLLADAKSKGCASVVTLGSTESNLCRSCAIACRQVGLDCHLLLLNDSKDIEQLSGSGNSLLTIIGDPSIYTVPWSALKNIRILQEKVKYLSDHIEKITGKPAYQICGGGHGAIGLFGYFEEWQEMMKQNVQDSFDDIVMACGSSDTCGGLAIANYLTGSQVKVHGISINFDAKYIHSSINRHIKALGITNISSEDIIDIIDNYIGDGYCKFKDEDIEYYKEIAKKSGILCDPIYTGKAVKALVTELKENEKRFRGQRILFIHTGGIFATFEEHIRESFLNDVEIRVRRWTDICTAESC